MREVLTFILAGGKGERLNPLTRDRAKPAVPFGGIYRIIDFTLSNCINSGLRRIYVLIQYKSFSLQKHLLAGWREIVSSQLGEFIDVIPAQQRVGADWYKGTADAIYQNIYAINDHNPELVLILAGDHIYKMNYEKMIDEFYKVNADVMISCIPMPKESSKSLGVVEVDAQNKVCGFHEKPDSPITIPGDSDKIFASMGIYLFKKDILLEALKTDANSMSAHDFGKNVLPQLIESHRNVYAYSFVNENNQPEYWRDIGTRDAYYQANMDLVQDNPEFNLYDRKWPVRTYQKQQPPIKSICAKSDNNELISSHIYNSLISGGCIIKGAEIVGSVISSNVRVDRSAKITNSVVMDSVTIGADAKVKNAIIDKQVVVAPGIRIGYDEELDRKRFTVTSSGIVIVPKRIQIK